MKHAYATCSHRLQRWLLWFLCLLLATPMALAQSVTKYTIKGSVTDFNGQPLSGVSVRLSDEPIGTITTLDGSYKLSFEAPTGVRRLVFSSVGFISIQENLVLTGNANLTINARLADANGTLNEVVVIASTISAPKRELGNQISTVKASDLAQSGTSGLLNSLQGKVPGAQIVQNSGDPAGSISVRLRGIKSLSGSSDPLYIVDGVIVSNQSANVSQLAAGSQIGSANAGQNRLADINPNDIESLNVINGAAAAAQYGSRAANGVVLITTKRGRAGTPRFTFSTSFSMNELRKSVPVNMVNKTFGNTQQRLYTIQTFNSQTLRDDALKLNPASTFATIYRDGSTNQLLSNVVDNVPRYNYFDQIFQTGYGTENALSVSGGSENTKYIMSLGQMTNQGIVKGTDFTRYNVRARIDQRLAPWLNASLGLQYVNSFSNEKANGNVFYSPINSVNIVNNIYDITQRDSEGNLKAVEGPRVNPLSTIEDMKFTQSTNRAISDLQLTATPFAGLTIKGILGIDAYGQVGQNYIRPYPYVAQAALGANLFPQGFAATGNNAVFQYNADLTAAYERSLGKSLSLNAIVGYNYQYFRSDYSVAQGQGITPFIETVSGATNSYITTYSLDRFNLGGYFGQATLGYKYMAYLTAAVRVDQSSKFDPSVINQTYPKLSGSVIVSDFDFWKNLAFSKTMSELKLRASYGAAGNLSGVGSYSRFYQFAPPAGGYLGKNTLVPGAQLANPLVRPERMTEFEAGVDIGLLDNRVNLSFTTYNQQISDLVVQRDLAPTTGGTSIVTNVGTMENKGIELMVNATPISLPNFTWDVTAIFSRNRNKVLSLGSPIITIDNVAGAPVTLLQGQPVGVFFGTGYARRADGTLINTVDGFPQSERAVSQAVGSVDYVPARTSDGQVEVAGRPTANIIIGNPNPKWTGSFGTKLTYKKLGLNVLFETVQGFDIFNADKRTRQGVGLGDFAARELTGDLKRGYIFAIYNMQEWRIDDGSFTKLRELSLSYNLPELIKGVNNINIALVGRNLISWDKYNGFDPETNAGGSNDLFRGVDFGNVPIPRTYQLKVTANF
ncbi:TonB-dependent receptor plug [Fibrella aestuarina BUZ 2]|uniref:TonB-dependent receptor plug n=1 Tax=Fibrella aestuarina BUZ 2 TaxID=1166018 RepID=I0K4Y2_9BACT|nr:SusC/RagA family TonB-linked outer membrane protein [Fibrella aestuarina]CCG99185.1 TonB-dependent receptor plug [Fibrella aestuarina BUZ 2]